MWVYNAEVQIPLDPNTGVLELESEWISPIIEDTDLWSQWMSGNCECWDLWSRRIWDPAPLDQIPGSVFGIHDHHHVWLVLSVLIPFLRPLRPCPFPDPRFVSVLLPALVLHSVPVSPPLCFGPTPVLCLEFSIPLPCIGPTPVCLSRSHRSPVSTTSRFSQSQLHPGPICSGPILRSSVPIRHGRGSRKRIAGSDPKVPNLESVWIVDSTFSLSTDPLGS